MTTVVERWATGRSLVDKHLFERLVQRIMADHDQDRTTAEKTMDQALVFLAACAQNTEVPLSPSEQVDIGWHTFILYTQEYAEFCQRMAGRFLHHVPEDEDDSMPSEALRGHDRMANTLAALNTTGLWVDRALWSHSAEDADCNQCYNGCHDSPKKK